MPKEKKQKDWVDNIVNTLDWMGIKSLSDRGRIGAGIYQLAIDLVEFENCKIDRAATIVGLNPGYGDIETLKSLGVKL